MPIYWAFLTYALLRPSSDLSADFLSQMNGIDKIGHWLVFVVLGFLFYLNFPKIKIAFFLGIMLLYAVLTEVLQGTMNLGRTMEFNDLIADMLGVWAGYFIWKKTETLF